MATTNPSKPLTRLNRVRAVVGQDVISFDAPMEFSTSTLRSEFLAHLGIDSTSILGDNGEIQLGFIPQLNAEQHASQAIDTRLLGKSFGSNSLIFTTTGFAAYDSACWAADIDLTAVSTANSSQSPTKGIPLIAIAADIAIAPYHANPANGTTLTWVDASGTAYTRTVSSSARVGSTDISVVKLSSALPASIHPALVLPSDFASKVTLVGLPVLKLDQDRHALVSDISAVDATYVTLAAPSNSQRLAFHEAWITGDSGSPIGLILDGRFVYLGSAYTATTAAHFSLSYSAVNAAIAGLGSSSALTPVTLPARQKTAGSDIFFPAYSRFLLGGGVTGQHLAKLSNSDYDVGWTDDVSSIAWASVTGKPLTDASTGGNGSADAGKAVIFGAQGGSVTFTGYTNLPGLSVNTSGGGTGLRATSSNSSNGIDVLVNSSGHGITIGTGSSSTGHAIQVQTASGATGNVLSVQNSLNGGMQITNIGALAWTYGLAKTTSRVNLLGADVSFSGAYTGAFTLTGNTTLTLPTTGTLATVAGTEVPLTFSTGLTRTTNTITANAVNLAASGSGGVTGTLPIANGGTGKTGLPCFRVYITATPALITTSGTKVVPVDTAEYDTGSGFDAATNSFVVPAGCGGRWKFSSSFNIVDPSTNFQIIQWLDIDTSGGTTYTRWDMGGGTALGGAGAVMVHGTGAFTLPAGARVRLVHYFYGAPTSGVCRWNVSNNYGYWTGELIPN
jgi:hypothetical protein